MWTLFFEHACRVMGEFVSAVFSSQRSWMFSRFRVPMGLSPDHILRGIERRKDRWEWMKKVEFVYSDREPPEECRKSCPGPAAISLWRTDDGQTLDVCIDHAYADAFSSAKAIRSICCPEDSDDWTPRPPRPAATRWSLFETIASLLTFLHAMLIMTTRWARETPSTAECQARSLSRIDRAKAKMHSRGSLNSVGCAVLGRANALFSGEGRPTLIAVPVLIDPALRNNNNIGGGIVVCSDGDLLSSTACQFERLRTTFLPHALYRVANALPFGLSGSCLRAMTARCDYVFSCVPCHQIQTASGIAEAMCAGLNSSLGPVSVVAVQSDEQLIPYVTAGPDFDLDRFADCWDRAVREILP